MVKSRSEFELWETSYEVEIESQLAYHLTSTEENLLAPIGFDDKCKMIREGKFAWA